MNRGLVAVMFALGGLLVGCGEVETFEVTHPNPDRWDGSVRVTVHRWPGWLFCGPTQSVTQIALKSRDGVSFVVKEPKNTRGTPDGRAVWVGP